MALVLLIFSVALLGYFLFFAFFNYLYTFASFFYKEPKQVKPSGRKVAIVKVSFNEKEVVVNTLRDCEQITYDNKMIVSADDSTDPETYEELVQWIQEKGGKPLNKTAVKQYHHNADIWVTQKKDFALIHRHENTGFKAGSMKVVEAYLKKQGIEYLYLLDSDWSPEADVIDKAMSVLEADEHLAFVQTKREHFNRLHGTFEHAASLGEESGFEIEYPGRQALRHPILFTGCCTLFRINALDDVGGFLPGHLTEDIDLTNRLYLRGWRGAYIPYATNHGEVAQSYRSLIKQQERWTMGTARTLKEFYRDVINSVHMNWFQRISLLRQNMYYSTAIAIELSILLSVITLVWIAFFPESYQATLYQYYLQRIGTPYTILIFVALISNFLPIVVALIKRKHYRELPYIFVTAWLFWSLVHTYFWANIKGVINKNLTWFRTPKTSGKKMKDTTPKSNERMIINLATLFLFAVLYYLEWYIYGWISPYAYFWIPAMTVGIFLA